MIGGVEATVHLSAVVKAPDGRYWGEVSYGTYKEVHFDSLKQEVLNWQKRRAEFIQKRFDSMTQPEVFERQWAS